MFELNSDSKHLTNIMEACVSAVLKVYHISIILIIILKLKPLLNNGQFFLNYNNPSIEMYNGSYYKLYCTYFFIFVKIATVTPRYHCTLRENKTLLTAGSGPLSIYSIKEPQT